jgi:suppressor of G2 allele of SKP1
MSHITIAEQGLKAMEASDWETAVSKLTTGLKHSENPTWLLNRSKALTRLNRSEEALADAELAWHYALARSKRELVAEANYRRAVAFHRLGQYANAAFCCSYSMRMNKGVSPLVPNEDPFQDFVDENGNCTMTQAGAKEEAAKDDYNKRNDSIGGTANMTPSKKIGDWRLASTLKMQVLARMEASPADDPGRKVTTTQKPERKPFSDLGLGGEGKTAPQPSKQKQATPAATSTAAAAAAAAASQPAKPAVPSNAPVRLDDFQNDTTMSVTIFSKGNDKSKLQVEFLPFSVRLDPIKYPSGEEKEFSLNLWGEIDVESSKHTVTPSKVELSLKKKTPGKWPQLRGETPAKPADEQLAEAKEKEM